MHRLIKEKMMSKGMAYIHGDSTRGIGKPNFTWFDEYSDTNYLLPKIKVMQKLSPMQKELLDEDTKTLIKAGYLDNDMDLTEEGGEVLNAIYFKEKKKELVAAAQAKLDSEVKK